MANGKSGDGHTPERVPRVYSNLVREQHGAWPALVTERYGTFEQARREKYRRRARL